MNQRQNSVEFLGPLCTVRGSRFDEATFGPFLG